MWRRYVVAGMNDVLRPSFDAARTAADVGTVQRALVGQGATVLTCTLPDPVPVMPPARPLRGRIVALNAALRRVTADTGATLVDFAAHPVASDPRLWSDDRLHANGAGHERIAAAPAYTAGLPGHDDSWTRPLAAAPAARPRGAPGRAGPGPPGTCCPGWGGTCGGGPPATTGWRSVRCRCRSSRPEQPPTGRRERRRAAETGGAESWRTGASRVGMMAR